VSHTLGANLENLTLTGAAASNATGNALNNVLIGNAASNVLSAGAGNDRLIGGGGTDTASYVGATAGVVVSLALTTAQSTGGAGTDTLMGIENLVGSRFNDILTGSASANALTGGPGDDRLDGGAGADRLAAGAGNDRYVVDHAGDVVLESEGAGTDTVRSGVDYTLAANVENLVLEATAGLAGTGNALANTLTGNAGSNLLRGGPGADLLLGGAGTDALAGGTGADTLTGGLGSDRFVLGSVAESPPGARDVIGDFSAAQRDRLDLAALDANATAAGDQAFLFIGGAAFSGAGQARFAGGLLQVNVDADLAADLEVQLLGVGSLAAADLLR
jgi:Ca2+-binding RTX toxin-like protein